VSSQRTSKPAYRRTAAAAVPPATEYVSKEIAAKRIGLSVRRVLELSQRGLLKRRTVRDPVTKRRQTVFREEDVDRIVTEGNRRLTAYRGGAGEVAALPPFQAVSAPPVAPDRPWLTINEAANYSGLPASFLLRIIGKQRLRALDVGVRPGGRYRVAKRDLDAIVSTVIPLNAGKKR
jgi:excisionase family DNA binding protein